MMASTKPRSSMTRPSATYITPMRLWSTLVIHSRHRYDHQPLTVTRASTARTTMMTTRPVTNAIGWSKGIAAQVSLPSMSASCLLDRPAPGHRVGPRLAGARDGLVDNVLEEFVLNRPVGRRRHGFARLRQRGIGPLIEHRPGAAHLRDPSFEVRRRHRFGGEPHVGEAVAAVHRR